MNIDPDIQALFVQARQSFERDAFVRNVMARIDRERRRTLILWASLGIAGIAVLALLAAPVLEAASMATRLLPVSLVDIETDWLRQLLAPINSIAAAIAITLLLVREFFRRIFR
jgi:hypothetical protein